MSDVAWERLSSYYAIIMIFIIRLLFIHLFIILLLFIVLWLCGCCTVSDVLGEAYTFQRQERKA